MRLPRIYIGIGTDRTMPYIVRVKHQVPLLLFSAQHPKQEDRANADQSVERHGRYKIKVNHFLPSGRFLPSAIFRGQTSTPG